LRVETYFQRVSELLDACLLVQSSNVSYDKRSTHEGFIRGEVHFIDGSTLHLREYVDVETKLDRLTYVYQYMDPARQLVFRYDNTGHHRKLNLPTYPHHKHVRTEENVIPSSAPDMDAILKEIESLVKLP
jgi:hypothetical protein